jgi:hypothetical protein
VVKAASSRLDVVSRVRRRRPQRLGRRRRSVEEVLQEALAPPIVAVMPVMAVMPVTRLAVGGLAISGLPITRRLRIARRLGITRARARTRPITRPARRGRRRRVRRPRGALPAVPVRLGLEQFFQLTAVEEDSAAFGALIDRYAAALVHSHLAVTLRTGHLHLTDGTRPGHRPGLAQLWDS